MSEEVELLENFSKNLKARRQELDLTQQKIANELEMNLSTYGKIENGVSLVNIMELFKLCEVLKINPQRLIEALDPTALLVKDLLPYAEFNQNDLNRIRAMISGVLQVWVAYDSELSKKLRFNEVQA